MFKRKDTKLIVESWRNFINEKSINTKMVDFKGMTSMQKDFVKAVPIDLNLYAIGDFLVQDSPISYYLVEAMKESKSLYKEIHKGLILNKSSINEIIEVLDYLLKNSNMEYEDGVSRTKYRHDQDEDTVKKCISQMKNDLLSLKKDSSGILLYFPRMASMQQDMADGTINNIGNIQDPAVWKNSLSWELKHDVFHYFEGVLEEENSYSYNFLRSLYDKDKAIQNIIKFFDVPEQSLKAVNSSIKFSSSFGDGDNFATVIPYIRSMPQNEASKNNFIKKCKAIADKRGIKLNIDGLGVNHIKALEMFFDEAHKCYEQVEEVLRDKIVIQQSHG